MRRVLLSEERRETGWQGVQSDGYLTEDRAAEQGERPASVQEHSHELP